MEPFDTATLILRVVLGVVMLAHGVKHARGRAKTSRWFGSIGFEKPELQWFASTVTEIGVSREGDWLSVVCRGRSGRHHVCGVLECAPDGGLLGHGQAG